VAKLNAAQVKARLADPKKRTTIPTAQLPAKYQAMRARAKAGKATPGKAAPATDAALDDPAALTAPLTPRTLGEQVAAQTNLAYSGQQTALQGQQGVHAQMETNIPAWFQAYNDTLAHASAAQERANAAAVAAQQNAADTSTAVDSQQRASLQSGLQADAITRGATVDPSVAATGQQAAASRRSSMDAFTGLQAGIGAATAGLAANRQVVAAGQGLSALQGERNVGLNLDRTAQTLAADRGNFAVTARQKLIDSEHTKTLENKAFDLNTQKAVDEVKIAGDKIKAKVHTDSVKARLARDKLEAQKEMDKATRSNNHARIEIAKKNLRVAERRAKAYETGQSTTAAGGVTVAEARRRNNSIAAIGGDYKKALDAARLALTDPDIKLSPSELGALLDHRFKKLPAPARAKIIQEAQGKNATPAQRRAYQQYLDDIRAGKISY
jgi:hypothetical protein